MTEAQWNAVEEKLLRPYGVVKLQADGYEILLLTEQYKMKLVIAVYVDGKIKGEWLAQDCEIRRKFYRCSTRSLLTRKEREKLKRNKKSIREEIMRVATYHAYSPYWESFRSLKRHLTKNCSTIVSYEEETNVK